ncbi:LITAF-like zinc ribbon domain-containing protein [Chytriomyces sp. MP71]|nr:LITAF-like zinc ribbon domain-containing protein [Chytriomyces sp. MP71]
MTTDKQPLLSKSADDGSAENAGGGSSESAAPPPYVPSFASSSASIQTQPNSVYLAQSVTQPPVQVRPHTYILPTSAPPAAFPRVVASQNTPLLRESGQTILTFTSTASSMPQEAPEPTVVIVDTSESVLMFCPFCAGNVVTVVENSPGCLAYLTSAFLCLIGMGLCFFVPLCAPRCQDQVHRCPACRRVLAVVPA